MINFSLGIIFLFFSYFVIKLLIRKEHYLKYIKRSVKWFYALCAFMVLYIINSVFNYLKGYSFGLYEEVNFIDVMMNYFLAIGLMVFILTFFIHLENDISSNQKIELKDKYSHNIGNILQVIYSAVELMELKGDKNKEVLDLIKLTKKKSLEASNLLYHIRKLDKS